MAHVWVVEDDERIGMLIQVTARKAGYEVQLFVDADGMENAVRKSVPDLLILDLMLRGKDGFTILREWKERKSTKDIPVIILSARSEERDRVQGLMLGAEDYMTKPFGVRELQARIHTALRRTVLQTRPTVLGPLTLDTAAHKVFLDGEPVELTYREFELLAYLVRHRDETVSREQLLKDVWGYHFENDPSRTVDYHIKALRVKLHDSATEPRIVRTVRGVGYRCIAGEKE